MGTAVLPSPSASAAAANASSLAGALVVRQDTSVVPVDDGWVEDAAADEEVEAAFAEAVAAESARLAQLRSRGLDSRSPAPVRCVSPNASIPVGKAEHTSTEHANVPPNADRRFVRIGGSALSRVDTSAAVGTPSRPASAPPYPPHASCVRYYLQDYLALTPDKKMHFWTHAYLS